MHPYASLDDKFFWAKAVGQRNMFEIDGLWDPKFRITKAQRIVTFGSCFAQHMGRELQQRGFNWTITEKAPTGLSAENARRFNYGVFSARTGNMYTVSLLKQWLWWAQGKSPVPTEVWTRDGRCYDPFRPNIEPNGFAAESEVLRSREVAIEAFRECVRTANVFIFTMGLTESWFNTEQGHEYPMCPGTVAGEFDASRHGFVNQDHGFIVDSMADVLRELRRVNPKLRVLLTVSPVPLTATKSGKHVLVASMESKSILRAVAGRTANSRGFVDYFPSYEIINATPYRGSFFEPNQRSVSKTGVHHVMNHFFRCLRDKFGAEDAEPAAAQPKGGRGHGGGSEMAMAAKQQADKAVCEEELLSAFSK
jgi:hypothetical protein